MKQTMGFRIVSLDEIDEEEDVPKRTNPYMTRFEFTKLVATRVVQLQAGAPCTIDRKPGMSLSDIAEAEVRARTAPLIVRRLLPDGSHEEWRLTDLHMIKL